jgi:hypothetical protein
MPGAPKTSNTKEVHTVRHHDPVSGHVWIDTTAGGYSSSAIPVATIILASAILLSSAGCAAKKLSFRPECPSLDAGDYYFPKGALDSSRPKIDGLLRGWYSKYLRAMGEPSLSCGPRADGYAYRFLWLRSFHHPIAVRLEKVGPLITLDAVELDGTGGHAPGKIVKRTQRALSPDEESKFVAKLDQVGFWEMRRDQDRFGSDGAQWILEGVDNGQYQVVQRWSPGPGAYREACILLLDLAGFKIPPAEFY